MSESTPKGRNGRPQKFPGEGARIAHATRLRPATAARLAEEAERNHRSLGEEIEVRINKSFDGVILTPPTSLMEDLQSASRRNNRSVEDEALSRITENNVAEVVKSALLSADFIQRQASIVTDFMRQQRVGIIIGRLLAAEADKPFPPLSKPDNSEHLESIHESRKAILGRMETEFEKLFGIGSVNKLVDRYDDEVMRLVGEASQGKYLVMKGRLQEINDTLQGEKSLLIHTGGEGSNEVHIVSKVPQHED